MIYYFTKHAPVGTIQLPWYKMVSPDCTQFHKNTFLCSCKLAIYFQWEFPRAEHECAVWAVGCECYMYMHH